MMSSSEEALDEVMKKYKEDIPETLNRRFRDQLPKSEAIKRQLERKQLPSTPLFPSCKFHSLTRDYAALVQEQEAASTVQSQPRKTRCCKKCGQPMKGHPRSQCPQESIDDHS